MIPTYLWLASARADEFTLILRPKGVGQTRVLVFGGGGGDYASLKRLIYDATVAVGSRVVTWRQGGGREVMDCAPGCYPSPTAKVRDPDQIIENRNVIIPAGKP
ncbi:hypothetical protein [Bradyrhizobium sp. JR3.5]